MEELRAEGVVLKTLPYQENQHIVTVFSREMGLLSFFVRKSQPMLTTPLTRATFVYRAKPTKSLYPLKEGALLDPYLDLRSDYGRLDAACAMARALLATQAPLKPAPDLYALFVRFLNEIEKGEHLEALVSSFLLKTLKHEGLSAYSEECDACGAPLTEAHFLNDTVHCSEHAPMGSIGFDEGERAHLLLLSASKAMGEITSCSPGKLLREKVEGLFTSLTA